MSRTTFICDDPFYTIADFIRLFDAAWHDQFSSTNREARVNGTSGNWAPRMDLHESKEKNQLTVTFELPGMKREDVSIDVHNNRLIVSGKNSHSSGLNKDGYVLRERRFGKFSRSLPVPSRTLPESIRANMDNGVLTVQFPKYNPDQEPKRIVIA